MEYSINKLARMSGISTRTLRYYDEIGLLKPARTASSGYRVYGRGEADMLQQILFYRELGFALDEIKKLIHAPGFERERAFAEHLAALHKQRERLDILIANVEKSTAAMKGEIMMSDNEKFAGFKSKLIADNEREFGAEIREKYGEQAVEEANARINGLSREQYDESLRINAEFEAAIKAALASGDPAAEMAQKACDLHRQWLCIFSGGYNKEYHRALGEMYVADERFRAHYDALGAGCSEFLRDALNIFCAE